MSKKKAYTLVGVDGNAFAIMGFTADVMEKEGFPEKDIDKMYEDAQSGNYYHLVRVCNSWIAKVNQKVGAQ